MLATVALGSIGDFHGARKEKAGSGQEAAISPFCGLISILEKTRLSGVSFGKSQRRGRWHQPLQRKILRMSHNSNNKLLINFRSSGQDVSLVAVKTKCHSQL